MILTKRLSYVHFYRNIFCPRNSKGLNKTLILYAILICPFLVYPRLHLNNYYLLFGIISRKYITIVQFSQIQQVLLVSSLWNMEMFDQTVQIFVQTACEFLGVMYTLR